jgi:putative DNA primase/helicase
MKAEHIFGAAEGPPAEALFSLVPMGDLMHFEPEAPGYWWDGYLPAGVVTLLGAHGGTGKSMLALMLGVCIALGLPLFGIPTKRGKVAFFSGEDGAGLMRYRLRWICRGLGVNVADLEGWLHILDATEGEPALFHEVGTSGRRQGLTTPSYEALSAYVDEHGIDVLIVDNASDAFDANEIDRAKVRGFMRSLARIAQARGGAVLLLAHVDKGTSRGDRGGSEGYSGSTAWHNSARSRLYLSRDKDGALQLEHQKHNLGRMREPLRLIWPEGGVPQADTPVNGFVQRISDGADAKTLLKLLHKFYARGEFIATDVRSRYNAASVLSTDAAYPKKRKSSDVFEMLRAGEQKGHIQRESYRSANRKTLERWALTAAGCEHIGLPAPSAPSAPSAEHSAPVHTAQTGAPSAPGSAQGGMGGIERAQNTARTAESEVEP